MVKDHSDSEKGNPLPPHRLTARVLLYAPPHRQDSTYHSLCYTYSRGAQAGTRNSSMGLEIITNLDDQVEDVQFFADQSEVSVQTCHVPQSVASCGVPVETLL